MIKFSLQSPMKWIPKAHKIGKPTVFSPRFPGLETLQLGILGYYHSDRMDLHLKSYFFFFLRLLQFILVFIHKETTNCQMSTWPLGFLPTLRFYVPIKPSISHINLKIVIKSALSFSKLNHHFSLQCIHLLRLCPMPGIVNDSRDTKLKESLTSNCSCSRKGHKQPNV